MKSFIGVAVAVLVAVVASIILLMLIAPVGFERLFGLKPLTAQYQRLDAQETVLDPEPLAILEATPKKELVIKSEEPLASAMVQLDDSICTFNAGIAASIVNGDSYKCPESGEINIITSGEGYVLKSGEIFSYNEAVGERVSKKGFVMSSIPVRQSDGSVVQVDSMGAGVCRLSVCLAWVADNAGLEIVQRTKHEFPPVYLNNQMNPGVLKHDATVFWPSIDNSFKNIKPYDIKIHTWLDREKYIIHADMYTIIYEE